MDPSQTLTDARAAVLSGNREQSLELLNHYAQWRFTGGFEPEHGDIRAAQILFILCQGLRSVP